MRNKRIFKMILIALLVALDIVVVRFIPIFSIPGLSSRITLEFLIFVIAGSMFGITGGVIVGGMGDLIGALLFPMGVYFFPFTIVNMLRGVLYGAFLKGSLDRKVKMSNTELVIRTAGLTFSLIILVNMVINSGVFLFYKNIMTVNGEGYDVQLWLFSVISKIPYESVNAVLYMIIVPMFILLLRTVMGNQFFNKRM